MVNNMFKLKIEPNLQVFVFHFKSLFVMVEPWQPFFGKYTIFLGIILKVI